MVRDSRDWKPTAVPAGQEPNEDRLRSLTDALGDLKIVGVRPKPPGLTDPNNPKLKLTVPIVLSLQSRGFYLVPGQGMYSDQGDVIVTTDEGVAYTLRYGGPVFATGEELSAGTPDTAEEEGRTRQGQEGRRQEVEGNSGKPLPDRDRLVRPDGSSPSPGPRTRGQGRGQARRHEGLPRRRLPPDPKDPKYLADQKAAEEKAKRDQADYEKKLADGQKR